MSDDRLTALPAFKALNDPHIRVHHAGHEVLEALAAGQGEAVTRAVAAMDGAAHEVTALLHRMGAEAQQRWAA